MARLTISMTGGGPWGFRLYGGDSDPLVVAKLRKRSKAADAGLQEGDAMLAINRYSCNNMTHQIAMALVDQSKNVSFEVLRGASDRNAVHAAIQTLGSEYKPAPHPPAGGRPTAAPAPSGGGGMVNGITSSQTESYQAGGQQVRTETSTQQFGSSTITKVRQEVSQTFSGAAASPRQAAPQPTRFVRAPPQAEQPMDFEQKENFNPNTHQHGYVPPSRQSTKQSMFAIKKVNTQQPKAIWQPSFIPDLPQHAGPHDLNLMEQEPDWIRETEPQPAPRPAPQPAPEPEYRTRPQPVWQPTQPPQPPQPTQQDFEGGYTYADDGIPRRPLLDQSEEEYARMMLTMIMHGEMGPESPNTVWRHKKKVYADSAFYDDVDHKYPTIEEQIKMARKVALSLEAPANQRARGHSMFVKRKEKAHRWVAGELQAMQGMMTEQVMQEEEPQEEEEKYYAPDPWQSKQSGGFGHTWHPSGVSMVPGPAPQAGPTFIPAPPPAPDFNWNKAAYKLPPGVSFKLAEDLTSMRGKGAKLFAKRKAKADQWVVGGDDGTDAPDPRRNDPDFLNKVTGGLSGALPGMTVEMESPTAPSQPSRPRLQEMIDPPKAAMTPWDAMASFGEVDRAFGHLDTYMEMKRGGGTKNVVAKSVKSAASTSFKMPVYTGGSQQQLYEPQRTGGPPPSGYRQINFTAPTAMDKQGVFDAGPSQWRAQTSRPVLEGGFCDL